MPKMKIVGSKNVYTENNYKEYLCQNDNCINYGRKSISKKWWSSMELAHCILQMEIESLVCKTYVYSK